MTELRVQQRTDRRLDNLDAWDVAHDKIYHRQTYPFTLFVELPTASEDITVLFFEVPTKILRVYATLVGSSSPQVDWQLHHDTDRSAAGTEIVDNVTTAETTPDKVIINKTVPRENYLWLETDNTSGTITSLSLIFILTEKLP